MPLNKDEARAHFLRACDEADKRFGQISASVETLRCALSRPDIEAPALEAAVVMLEIIQSQVKDARGLWESFARVRLAALGASPGAPPPLRLV